jgi:crossover junction endodeoxyribonuclease RuvC
MGNNKVAMGLDLALNHSGIVILDSPHNILLSEIFKPQTSGTERLWQIYNRVLMIFKEFNPDLCVIEGYAYGKPFQAHQLGEVGGVIRLIVYNQKIAFTVVPPKRAKLFATGSGKANKDLIMLSVFKNWGIEFNHSDLADAYVLALIGLCKIKPDLIKELKLNKTQQNIIDNLFIETGMR